MRIAVSPFRHERDRRWRQAPQNRSRGVAEPGRPTTDALQLGAEALLAELALISVTDGAALHSKILFDNFRIVDGLYVTAR